MHVVVGLGNPGAAYATTRHNVGFMVVARLADRWGVLLEPDGRGVRAGAGVVAGKPVLLVQPHLFMNRSGDALSTLDLDWENCPMVAVYDDLDLPVGRLRLKRGGGTGGHRGVESLVARFGGGFARVRIGIGRPSDESDVADYVLRPMGKSEADLFEEPIERAGDAIECVLSDGIEVAMNRFNGRAAADRGADSERR